MGSRHGFSTTSSRFILSVYGVKRPAEGQIMGKILCEKLRYSEVVEQAMQRLKKSLIPGFGR
ncbi:hypothetical protein [Aphanothece hegewaldii]|uniref:hypothetical protein n=1 Tax=Aphanothece hegewaldii TaxID=1521625 RepID=UPI0015E652BB|nr:hypothetical protein [Aphanothece hegewaldii]